MNSRMVNLPQGYMGKILTVDLSNRGFKQDLLNPGLIDRVFGGRGLGIALLTDHFINLQNRFQPLRLREPAYPPPAASM
jgi:aldehyde:ferredoxin oxidoreductase